MQETRAFYVYLSFLILIIAYILGSYRAGVPSILSLLP